MTACDSEVIDEMSKEAYSYCRFFCEENILLLYEDLCKESVEDMRDARVLFISNPQKCCAFYAQTLGIAPHYQICWDYHVVLYQVHPVPRIWDFDSRLGFCTQATEYFRKSFFPFGKMSNNNAAYIRSLCAKFYAENFSSNRNLINPKQAEKIKFPDWPKIFRGELSLERCIDFNDGALASFVSLETFMQT